MSKVQLAGNASGTGIFTIASPNSNTDRTQTLPDASGTLLNTGSTAVITPSMFAANAISTNTYTSAQGTLKFNYGNAAPNQQPITTSFTLSEAEAPIGSYVVLQQLITSGNSAGVQYCSLQQKANASGIPGLGAYITGWYFTDIRMFMFYISSAADRTFNVTHGTISYTNNNDSRNIYYNGYIKVTQ